MSNKKLNQILIFSVISGKLRCEFLPKSLAKLILNSTQLRGNYSQRFNGFSGAVCLTMLNPHACFEYLFRPQTSDRKQFGSYFSRN